MRNRQYGVIRFYYSFLKYLAQEKKKIAVLQLVGKLEDYLTKEFVYHVHRLSGGKIRIHTNLGNRKQKEKSIDISLLKVNNLNRMCISGLIEVKYLTNKQKRPEFPAEDQIYTSIKELYNQTGSFQSSMHGGYDSKGQAYTF